MEESVGRRSIVLMLCCCLVFLSLAVRFLFALFLRPSFYCRLSETRRRRSRLRARRERKEKKRGERKEEEG